MSGENIKRNSHHRMEEAQIRYEVQRERERIALTAGYLGILAVACSLGAHFPLISIGCLAALAVVWAIHSVLTYRVARAAMRLGFMQGTEAEIGLVVDALEKGIGKKRVEYENDRGTKSPS